jgi:poly(beta-D-mannuronate) lyase
MVQWTVAALALDELKIRDAPGLDAEKRRAVEQWLAELGDRVRRDSPDYRNNHAYWAALAMAAAGAAASDRALLDAGLQRFDLFVKAVREDGTLPLEMDRRSRALHYHLFALEALVLLAEVAAANGVDLYARGDRAIDRLADRCLAGLADPAAFGRAAGADQHVPTPSDGGVLGWMEPYYARFHKPAVARWLARARPVRDEYLGGDLTLRFGAPLAP